jgi:hypothetical protein
MRIQKTGTCSLCSSQYQRYGNNPWPLNRSEDDRCCDTCNTVYVIPERFRRIDEWEKENGKGN